MQMPSRAAIGGQSGGRERCRANKRSAARLHQLPELEIRVHFAAMRGLASRRAAMVTVVVRGEVLHQHRPTWAQHTPTWPKFGSPTPFPLPISYISNPRQRKQAPAEL